MATPPDSEQRTRLTTLFPLLAHTPFAIRGPAARYNCIAWAVGNTTDIWWPDRISYWPIRRFGVSLEVFIAAFREVGFELCSDPNIETSFEKIALYTLNNRPTHAARIESDTLWTSKLGLLELIEHEPGAVNGAEYGTPTHIFRRRKST
jgi:hypothetical protein